MYCNQGSTMNEYFLKKLVKLLKRSQTSDSFLIDPVENEVFFDENCVIVAYPELIEPLKVKRLQTPSENKKEYIKHIKKNKDHLHRISENINLYQLPDEKKFMVFDNTDKMVLYEMHYEMHKIFGYDFAVQSFVWSSPDLINYTINGQNISSYVFFNLLMNAAEGIAIATDAFHTPSGREFWLRRVSQAFFKKQNVYLIDILQDIKVKIKNSQEFKNKIIEMKIWTKGKDKVGGQNRRVIISPTKLW